MNDIKEKFENMKKQIKESMSKLEQMLEDLKSMEDIEPEKKIRFRCGLLDRYWYADAYGDVRNTPDDNAEFDDFNYKTGNYFETEQEARDYKERLLITQELKDLALELNVEKFDWNDNDMKKYTLRYDTQLKEIKQRQSYQTIYQGIIYCTNENFLDEALKRIGKDKLLKLFMIK
jgi:hypothetical protein